MTSEQVYALWDRVKDLADEQKAAILCFVWGYLGDTPQDKFFEAVSKALENKIMEVKSCPAAKC